MRSSGKGGVWPFLVAVLAGILIYPIEAVWTMPSMALSRWEMYGFLVSASFSAALEGKFTAAEFYLPYVALGAYVGFTPWVRNPWLELLAGILGICVGVPLIWVVPAMTYGFELAIALRVATMAVAILLVRKRLPATCSNYYA